MQKKADHVQDLYRGLRIVPTTTRAKNLIIYSSVQYVSIIKSWLPKLDSSRALKMELCSFGGRKTVEFEVQSPIAIKAYSAAALLLHTVKKGVVHLKHEIIEGM